MGGRKSRPVIDADWCQNCREREAAPDPRAPLENPKWEKFARNIALLNMTNAEAYAKAGFAAKNKRYSGNQACLLRKKLEICNRLVVLAEKAIAGDLLTRRLIHERLQEIVDRCMQKKPVMVGGKASGEWAFDARGANTALQLMGKDLGMFVEKVQIVEDDLASKSPEEVQEVLKALAIDLGRDPVRMMGEAVGLFEASSETAGTVKKPTVEPVSTVQ